MFHLSGFPDIDTKGKVQSVWGGPYILAGEYLDRGINELKDEYFYDEFGDEGGWWEDDVYMVEIADGMDMDGYIKWRAVPADPQPERIRRNDKRVIECVLTDAQLSTGWGRILNSRGFIPVSRFLNSNSGNVCTVFHLHPDGVSVNLNDIPTWNDPEPIKPTGFYRNVYKNRKGTGKFASYDEATAADRRGTRISCESVTILADGSEVIVPYQG